MLENNIKPISPDEVEPLKADSIPSAVFEAFNALIVENYHNGSSTVQQEAVLKAIVASGLKRQLVFDKHWLDVEPAYRAAGWEVEYNSPGYSESGNSYFVFTKPRKA